MGTVYLALDEEEDRPVALKVVHPHLLERKGFFKRFEREARAGLRVNHPNVVRVLDTDLYFDGSSPWCFLVLEYVEGRSLLALKRELGTVPEELVREIAIQAAAGLMAIHEAGIVHRDIKPANILITRDHRVRIMDLGVALLTEAKAGLTETGQFTGSVHYAAPEQFESTAVGPAADLYALGVTLYELATGLNPFRFDDPSAAVHAHLEIQPRPAQELVPDLTPFLSDLLAVLLSKSPEDRFGSAGLLRLVLAEGESSDWWAERERARSEERDRLPRIRVRRETALHGRDEDLVGLREALRHARKGEGNVVLVEGEAGIGKTRLVDEFLRSTETDDLHVLYGSYAPGGGAEALAESLLDHFGDRDIEDSLTSLIESSPRLVPAFAAMLKRGVAPAGSERIEGDALHAVFVNLMRGLAAERPLLWIVDDLHFAGPDSRLIVLSLARALRDHPVLLVVTARPGLPEDLLFHLGRLEHLRRMSLARLGARDVVLLLEEAFRSTALAEKLGGKIALKSDGVPFFVFEMIQGLRDGQFITELPDGTFVETRIVEEIEVPSSVRDLIDVRLQDLDEDERTVLDVGSVLGYEFDADLVARALGRRKVGVLQTLAVLERRSGLVQAESRAYRFDHHQLTEVLYAEIPPPLREEYHALLAEAYIERERIATRPPDRVRPEESEFLANHLLMSSRPAEAFPHLLPALKHLAGGYRNHAAVELAGRALETEGLLEGDDRVLVLLELADRLDVLGRRKLQEEALAEALELASEDLRWRVHRRIGSSRLVSARYDEAEAELTRAFELAPEERAGIARDLGLVFFRQGRYAEAGERLAQSLALAEGAEDRPAEAAATVALGNLALVEGRKDEALNLLGRAVGLARGCGSRVWEAKAEGGLGNACFLLGRHGEAREHFERMLDAYRGVGHRRGEGEAIGLLASISRAEGRLEEAEEHYEESLAIAVETGDRLSEATATGLLGRVLADRGRLRDAEACFRRWLDVSTEIGDRENEAFAHGHLGTVSDAQGRFEEAREHHERHRAIAAETGDRPSEGMAAANLGEVCLSLGRLTEAGEHFERALLLARRTGDREGEGGVLAALGRLSGRLGDTEAATEALTESLEIFRDIGARVLETRALSALGEVCEHRGEPAEAARCYEEALAAQREIGYATGIPSTLVALGRVRAGAGRRHEAVSLFEKALRSREAMSPSDTLVAVVNRALLKDDPEGAARALEEEGEKATVAARMAANFALYRAAGDAAHLAEAERLLDGLVAGAPEEHRESMPEGVLLHREIRAAATAQKVNDGAESGP